MRFLAAPTSPDPEARTYWMPPTISMMIATVVERTRRYLYMAAMYSPMKLTVSLSPFSSGLLNATSKPGTERTGVMNWAFGLIVNIESALASFPKFAQAIAGFDPSTPTALATEASSNPAGLADVRQVLSQAFSSAMANPVQTPASFLP